MDKLVQFRFTRIFVLIFVSLFTISSCATKLTYIPHTRASSIQKYLKPGDKVVIETRDKKKVNMTITSIDNNRMVGSEKQVLISEISSLQQVKTDRRKNAVITGAALYTALIAITAILLLNGIFGG